MNSNHKKSKILIVLLASVLLAFVFVACSSSHGKQGSSSTIPDIGIVEDNLNQKIRILAPEGWNEFNTKKPIFLSVDAISQEIIIFNPNHTKIFIYSDMSWVEISNKMTYEPPDFTYSLDPHEEDFLNRFGDTAVFPDLPDPNKPATVRIFVFGYINKDGVKTDQMVASYIDINLEP